MHANKTPHLEKRRAAPDRAARELQAPHAVGCVVGQAILRTRCPCALSIAISAAAFVLAAGSLWLCATRMFMIASPSGRVRFDACAAWLSRNRRHGHPAELSVRKGGRLAETAHKTQDVFQALPLAFVLQLPGPHR
jgi:hypothetical protein